MAEARSRLDEQATEVGSLRTELRSRAAGVDERRTLLTRRLGEIDERLARDAVERAEAAERREEIERRIVATDRLLGFVQSRHDELDLVVRDLRERRRQQSEATAAGGREARGRARERAEAEHQLEQVRERLARAELADAEARLRIESAVEALRRDLDCDPDRAVAAECPPLPEGTTPAARVRELERELRSLGPINPLALEEFEALQERHTFLEGQLDDVRQSRRELSKVIRAIDEEIVRVFAAAFADVAANFEHLFQTLFPGGMGRLTPHRPRPTCSTRASRSRPGRRGRT